MSTKMIDGSGGGGERGNKSNQQQQQQLPNGVDLKLLHLVRKLSKSLPLKAITTKGTPQRGIQQQQHQQSEVIVQCLRTQYKEYQRKDIRRLTTLVEATLHHIMFNNNSNNKNENHTTTTTKNSPQPVVTHKNSSRKRKIVRTGPPTNGNDDDNDNDELLGTNHNDMDSNDDDDDDAYEQAALMEESARQTFLLSSNNNNHNDNNKNNNNNNSYGGGGGSGGFGLNATLRDRYRKIQQERDEQQKKDDELVMKDVSLLATKEEVGERKNSNNDSEDNNDTGDMLTSQEMKRGETADQDKTVQVPSSSSKQGVVDTIVKRRKSRGNTTRLPTGSSSSSLFSSSTSGAVATYLQPVHPRPVERYSDLGGMDNIIQQIRQLVEYPLIRPELYQHLGVDPPRGVLLRGPPGTGKTHLANAVAGQLGIPFYRVSAPELVSGMSGESESRIRELFQVASDSAPSLIFMDELDVIAQKRGSGGGDSGRGMEKRMVAQLLTCMDQVKPANNRNQQAVVILAATNRPDAMDPALRRAGRFDKEILLGVPDEAARTRIIRTMTMNMRLSGDFHCPILARKTPGYVGADIKSLAKEAAVIAINRIFRDVLRDDQHVLVPTNTDQPVLAPGEVGVVDMNTTTPVTSSTTPENIIPLTAEQMDPLYVTMDDFLAAIPHVQPSAQREGFATVPDVTWDDIGALQCIRDELKMSVLEPIRNPERFEQLGLPLPAGVMLYGPPGCGKTLLAKAIAHESGANFISVKGPELLDKYVGESERAVRLVFERARSSSPCIIFFDELDSLVPRRGSDRGGGGGVSERVVNQLLTEMDGLESRRSVFVIAATNRPELIDPAMLRPGRLDKLLYVPLPTPDERVHILRALATKVALHKDVDLERIARSTRADGYSGADCAALLREAGLAVLKEHMTHFDSTSSSNPSSSSALPSNSSICSDSNSNLNEIEMNENDQEEQEQPPKLLLSIGIKHFDDAFHSVMPSVSRNDQARYDRIRDRMARARSRGGAGIDDEQQEQQQQQDSVEPHHENGKKKS